MPTREHKVLMSLRKKLRDQRREREQADEMIRHYAHAILLLEQGESLPKGIKHFKKEAIGITEGAERVMIANGDEPMSVRELAAKMGEIGVRSDSKRFSTAVYVTVQQSPRFCRLEDGSWVRASVAPKGQLALWRQWQAGVDEKRARARRARMEAEATA